MYISVIFENFLEYLIDSSPPIFSILSFSISHFSIIKSPILNLYLSYLFFAIVSFPLLCLLFSILSFFPSIQYFFISAFMSLLPSAHFYSLKVPFYSIVFLFNGNNIFSYPLEDINNTLFWFCFLVFLPE